MPDYPLIITAYRRGKDHKNVVKPYHWALFIRTSNNTSPLDNGVVHQLRGMPSGYFYGGAENITDMRQSGSKCNEVDIGSVSSSKFDRVTEICTAAPIDLDEATEWNCQDWTIAVVEELKKEGFIESWITEEYMRGFLKETDV